MITGLSRVVFCGALIVTSARAAEPDSPSLADLSLEQLMDIVVTSVSRKEQKVADVAAAVTVLSGADLRRSGELIVADTLRLIPGANVGSLNSSQWAISARGFNGVYSNKLLVLVDGRAVYTPIFAGVHWDLQQTLLDDLDRIEVIRGPGATVWGANAVNGVISIVTRDASETQGALVYGGGGNVHEALAGVRYGGQLDADTHYRVFASYRLNGDNPRPDGQDAGDGWQGGHAGFRLDREHGDTHLTWQADATVSDLDAGVSSAHNFNTLGRWQRQWSEGSSAEIQAYFDQTARDDVNRAHTVTDTFDFSAQHAFGLGPSNDLIWGLGIRSIRGSVEQTNPAVQVRNPDFTQQLYSVFAQDEFRWVPERFAVTAGVKLEHNDYTGFEVQPSVRAAYTPTRDQTVWAAVSRAVRTPSVAEGTDTLAIRVGAPAAGPGGALFAPTLVGNPDLAPEILWAYELGYRIQPTRRASIDLAAFHNRYSQLISFSPPPNFVPGTPVGTAEFMFDNLLGAESNGGELAVQYSPVDAWRLGLTYSLLAMQVHGASDPLSLGTSAPRHQAGLQSAFDFTPRVNLAGRLRYVDAVQGIASYVTADVRFSWRLTSAVELSVVGQNLLDASHAEQRPQLLALASEVPRSLYAKLVWRFL